MKRKILYVIIFLGVIFFVDFIVGYLSKRLISKVPDIGASQTNCVQALCHRKASLIVLGQSTAVRHYDTRILADSLRLSVYNAGWDGHNIRYSAMVFYSFLQRCKPKIVCIDLYPEQLNSVKNDAMNDLYPFYGLSHVADSILENSIIGSQKYKLYSNLYRYNNTWQWLLYAYCKKETDKYNGFRPLEAIKNESVNIKNIDNEGIDIDKENLYYLDNIVHKCKEEKINLFFSISPSLIVANHSDYISWIHSYSKKNDVELIDLSHDQRFLKNTFLFHDYTHLNCKGAVLFSQIIVDHIRQSMKKASQ